MKSKIDEEKNMQKILNSNNRNDYNFVCVFCVKENFFFTLQHDFERKSRALKADNFDKTKKK